MRIDRGGWASNRDLEKSEIVTRCVAKDLVVSLVVIGVARVLDVSPAVKRLPCVNVRIACGRAGTKAPVVGGIVNNNSRRSRRLRSEKGYGHAGSE